MYYPFNWNVWFPKHKQNLSYKYETLWWKLFFFRIPVLSHLRWLLDVSGLRKFALKQIDDLYQNNEFFFTFVFLFLFVFLVETGSHSTAFKALPAWKMTRIIQKGAKRLRCELSYVRNVLHPLHSYLIMTTNVTLNMWTKHNHKHFF